MNAIIIEDEESSRITLNNMISKYCEGVQIVAQVGLLADGIKAIREKSPELVFLDIELPEENGFKLFDYFPKPSFEIIFTTAYGEYALNALKMSAVDYLLKPIDIGELRNAIRKVKEKRDMLESQNKLEILKGNVNNVFKKIGLSTNEGYFFVELEDIIRCEAQGNYTMFYLVEGEKVLVSKTLKMYDELLSGFNFFRISRSQLINLIHVKKFGRQKSPTITLENGVVLNVSVSRKDAFIKKIENLI